MARIRYTALRGSRELSRFVLWRSQRCRDFTPKRKTISQYKEVIRG